MDRRRFLAGLSASVTGASLIGRAIGKQTLFFGPGGHRLGLQLYTVQNDLQKDFLGTLKQVRQAGYQQVELAGFAGHSPPEFAAALTTAGLRATSAHISASADFPGEDLTLDDIGAVMAACKALGLKYVILPGIPVHIAARSTPGEDLRERFVAAVTSATSDDYLKCAKLLNEKGAQLAAHGVQLGYHSHNFEFAPLGNATGFEILMRHTDPKIVTFELDVGWLAAAGLDPVTLLTKHPGRIRAIHIKDIKSTTKPNFALEQDPAEVGAGVIPWPKILPVAQAIGVREYFVEQEPPFSQSALISIKQSADYLNTLAG